MWRCGWMGSVAPNDPPTLRSWFIITHVRVLGFTYNHIYKKSNSLILYAHTNIHHHSIFALNHKQFHSTYNYTHTIHAELKTLFNLLFILNHMLLDSIFSFIWNTHSSISIINSITAFLTFTNTDSKWIIMRFIRFYIDECWSSFRWSVV